MNERINAIIEQVGMTLKERQPYDEENYPGYGCSDIDHFHDNLSAVRAFFDGGLEKFAELIIKECTKAFESEVDTWQRMDPYQGSIKRQGTKAIKTHFGVEE